VAGIRLIRQRPIRRALRQGRAAFGPASGTSSTLATAVTGGRRHFLGPLLRSVPCTPTLVMLTGTTAAVSPVSQSVASEIKCGV